MNLLTLSLAVGLGFGDLDPQSAPDTTAAPSTAVTSFAPACAANCFDNCNKRPLFLSDHEFDSFIGPISNPILSKDPRSNTYLRPMFINNNFPGDHALGGGSAQIYAMQANIAVNERLSIIADKDGLARIDTDGGVHSTGFVNLAAGLKYTFLRNVETQTLAAAGFMYEIPSGQENVFQGYGSGTFTTFLAAGQKLGNVHVLNTFGYQFPANTHYNSSFIYNSFHLDVAIADWIYPLVEMNIFRYTGNGDQFPPFVGEGDGLLNLGTQGVVGNTLVTVAFGAKAKLSCNLEVGAAYEIPISDRQDIIADRIIAEVIIRY